MDIDQVNKIAYLARIKLSETEKLQIAERLTKILTQFDKISEVQTQGVEPLITPTEISAHWRKDEVRNELTPEQILANAPVKQGHLFKVPPVI